MTLHQSMGLAPGAMATFIAHLYLCRYLSHKFHFSNCTSVLVFCFHYLSFTSVWKSVSDVSVLQMADFSIDIELLGLVNVSLRREVLGVDIFYGCTKENWCC